MYGRRVVVVGAGASTARPNAAIALRALVIMVALVVSGGSAHAELADRSWYERWYQAGSDTLGKTLFFATWPTANYQGIDVQTLTPAPGGADLTVRIWGRSSHERRIWTDVIINFRNFEISELRFGRHGHVFLPPGATLQAALQSLEQRLQGASPPPRMTSTWATACVQNTTDVPITYAITWGGMRETWHLLPGDSRLYRAQGGEPEFHVSLDTSLDRGAAERTFAISTALSRDEPTACQDDYTFELRIHDDQLGLGAAVWTPGSEHPFLRHVSQSTTPERWICEQGYRRLYPEDADDLRCVP